VIKGVIIGGPQLVDRLNRIVPVAKVEIQKSMGRLVLSLVRRIKQKLSGEALNVRTGRLRRSVTSNVSMDADAVRGIASTNVEYAAKHEYGFKGTETVKAHLRLIKKAFGKTLRFPVYQNVGTHTRQVNFPERSFMRTALTEMTPEIRAEFNQALTNVVKA
jgi:phage gpG-like protein